MPGPFLTLKAEGNGTNALKTKDQELSETQERLEQRRPAIRDQQSDLTTADTGKGKGKQKMEPALAPPNDGHSMGISHSSVDKIMQLTQYLAAAVGIKESHPKSEDQAGPSSREERRAGDSATADKAEESLDDKAAKRPPSSAGFDRDIHPTEDDLEELYRRDDPQ